MKRFKITPELAEDIFTTTENHEYVVWANNERIIEDEMLSEFHLTKYENNTINLEHNSLDFRVEDIVLSNTYHGLEEL